jgi:uncharacterized protein YdaT
MFTEKEYNDELKKIQKREEKGSDDLFPSIVLVDGYILPRIIPIEDDFYDGASFWFITTKYDEKGTPEEEKK